jgi:hypothetical protein
LDEVFVESGMVVEARVEFAVEGVAWFDSSGEEKTREAAETVVIDVTFKLAPKRTGTSTRFATRFAGTRTRFATHFADTAGTEEDRRST